MKLLEKLKRTGVTNSRFRALALVLAVVCLIQGVVIYRLIRPEPDPSNNIEDFSDFIHEKFSQNKKSQWDSFDRFFDDDFFNKKGDPFDDMEQFHKRMEEMMDETLRGPFNRSWDSWFDSRFSGSPGQINIETREKEDSYLVILKIPNLKDNKLDIKIEEDGISVNGELTQIIEKKDADGNVISRHESRQTIARKFPIPGDADHEKADIKHKKDEITIVLPKVN